MGIKPVLVIDNGVSRTDKISTDVRVKLSSQDSLLIPIGYGVIYSYDSGKNYTQEIYNGGNFIIPQQNNNVGNKNILIRVILGRDTSALNEGINVVLATTPDKTSIKGVSKTGNQIQVSWTKPFDGGTIITGYEIQAISTIGDTIITNIDTVKTDTSYLIGRIKTNTGYKVTIKAINAIGKSITTDTSDNIFIFQTITPQLVNDNGVSTTDKITSDGRTYILPTGVFKDSALADRFLIPLVQYAYLQEPEYYNNTLLTASYLTINGTIAKRCVKYYNLEPHPSFPITQNNCDTAGFKVVNISNNVTTGLEIKSNMVYKYSLDSGKTYVIPVSGVYIISTSAGYGNKNTRVKLFFADNSDSSELGTGLSFTLSNTPTKPTNVIAAKLLDTVNNKIQVSWKKPVDTVVAIRNYNIIGIASNGANLSATALGTDTSYTFTNITNNVLYNFVVQASNDIGVSLSDTTKNTLVFIKPISPLVYNDNGVSTTDKITSDGRFYVLPEVQSKLYNQGGSLVDFGGVVIAFKNYTDAFNSISGISQSTGYFARAYYLGDNGDLRVTCRSPNNSYNIINESYPGGSFGCARNYSTPGSQWLSVSNTTLVAVVPLGYNFKYSINGGADINPGSYINGLPNVAGSYSVKIKLSAPNNVDSVVGSPLVYTLVTVPDTPINVLALAGDSIATISFVAPLNTGGLSIDSFKVVSTPGNKSITGNTSPLIIRGLQNNTAYSFAVTAFNNVGSSAPRVSNIVIPNKYYNITTEVVNGSILSNQTVARYGSIRITYRNNTGYILDSVIVNGVNKGKDSINGYTFKNVLGDSNIRLVYTLQTFTITATAGNGGQISDAGILTQNYGTRPSYTFTPNIGYVLDSVTVNGLKVTINNNIYTFDSLKYNRTIHVTFKLQTFTITASSGTGGTISSTGITNVNYNDSFRYNITTNVGYVVDSLIVNDTLKPISNTYLFTNINADHTIRVKFKLQSFRITASAGPGGSINPTGNSKLNYGENKTYFITPSIGYQIDSVTVNGIKIIVNNNVYTFDSVKSNHSIIVTFKIQTFTLTASAGTGGSITPLGVTTVNYGISQTYSISPNVGYVIDSAIVNGIKVNIVNNSYTFDSVKSTKSIAVYFKQITKPSKPLNVIASVGNTQTTISFSNSIEDGGVSIIKYIVQAVVGGSQRDSNISGPITITGLTNGQQYKFSVKAVNSYGLESDTTESNIIIPDNNIRNIRTNVINGTITKDTSVALGSNVLITYNPKEGYELDSIYINDIYSSTITNDSINKYTFKNVLADSSIRVVNKIKSYTITSSAGTGGSISPLGINTLNYGAKPRYIITTNTGYLIDSLFVNNVKVDSTTSYTFDSVKSNQSISVKFKVKTFTITSSAGTGGSISPLGNSTVNYGAKPRYTITPNTGYLIDSLFVNNVKVDSTTSYTFDSVKSNQSISVKFKVQTFTVASSAGTGGSISPQGTSTLNYGTKQRYTIATNTGYVIDTVFVNNVKVDSTTSYTFDSVKSNQSISVKFKVQTFNIISSAGTGGSISPQGASTLNYGSKPRYTIATNIGYVIDTVFVNNLKVDSTTSYTFDSVKSNQSISVKFKVQTFNITSSAGTGGSISPQGTSTLNYGTKPRYTIATNTGYVIDSLFVNNVKVDSTTSYTFDSVKSNQSISVKFKVQTFTITSTAGTGGSISPQGTSSLNYGSRPRYAITH